MMGRGPLVHPQTPEHKQTLPEREDGSFEVVWGVVWEAFAYFLLLPKVAASEELKRAKSCRSIGKQHDDRPGAGDSKPG